MNESQLIAELERLEQWFRAVCPPVVGPDRSAIRRVMQIAIAEQSVVAGLRDAAPDDLAQRAKGRVHEALAETSQANRRTIRLAWWLGSGLSAAAALGLAVIGLRSPTEPVDHAEPLSLVSAFEQFADDEFDAELSQLQAAMFDSGDAIVDGDDWLEAFDDSEDANDGA